jgi:hypothetical protein
MEINLEGSELPDFPWRKESHWMTIEEIVRPAAEEKLAEMKAEEMALTGISSAQYDAFAAELLDSVFTSLRTAFDKTWPGDFSITMQTIFPGEVRTEQALAAIKAYGQAVANQASTQFQQWFQKYQLRSMMQLFWHEFRIATGNKNAR